MVDLSQNRDRMPFKPLMWCGDSRERIREFPREARREAGLQLNRVQAGREPDDWKPMSTAGVGVREIRLHEGGEHRVLYVAKFAEAVYVLHAFEKKTRKTPDKDIDLAERRFRALVGERRRLKL